MAKNNIRSIRFSDDLAELIERQAGQTFTEKFERLITRCVWELPRQEERLKEIQERIRQEQERLLENDIHTAQHYFKFVERRAKQIAEAAEKEL